MTRILSRSRDTVSHSSLPRDWRVAAAMEASVDQSPMYATQVLLQARQQARLIIAAAEEEGLARVAAAEQRGWEQGYAAGQQHAQLEMAGSLQHIGRLATETVADYEASAYQLDRELTGLALSLARVIVQHEVHIAPETVLAVARAAMREISVDRAVTLRVHPADAVLLQERSAQLSLPDSVQLSIVADSLINAGGCVVETGSGRIDATIEQQVERLERLLYEQLDATVA